MDKFSHAEARKCLEKAIALDSSFAKAYMMLTRLKWMEGDEEGAYDCIRKALAHKDRLTEQERLWMSYAKAEFDGDIPTIVSSVRSLLTLEPNDIETRMRLANMLFELRRHDKAIEHFKAALALDPTLGIAYNQLAYLHTFRGDFATALEYVDQYADLHPEEPNPYDSKGEILLWAGRLQEASDNFKISLSKRPDYENSLKLLSVIHSELDDIANAEQYLDRWIASAANPAAKSHAYIRKAMLHWRFGDIGEAKTNLDLAQKVSPNSIYPIMVAAEMYRSVQDTMAARQLYESFFTTYDNLAEGKKPTAHELSYVLKFIMEAPLPTSELIPVLTKITNSEKRALQRFIYQIHLGVLHLRNGSYEEGMEYLGQYSEDILTLTTELPNYGWSMWRYHSEAIQLLPEPPFDATERFLKAAVDAGREDLVVIAKYFLAQVYSRTGEEQKMREVYAQLGATPEDNWLVIGPFKNHNGFLRSFPPESEFDTDAVYREGERRFKWRSAKDGIYDGYINLEELIPPASWAVGYGAISLYSPHKQAVQIRLGVNSPCKLWLNNKLVWQTYPTKHVAFEDNIVSVMLHPGDNNILVKSSNMVGDWGFYFRVTDEDGQAVEGLRYNTPKNSSEAFALGE
jgi:tetratricopeptide (TPR) repeat protein